MAPLTANEAKLEMTCEYALRGVQVCNFIESELGADRLRNVLCTFHRHGTAELPNMSGCSFCRAPSVATHICRVLFMPLVA
jgi:hypothetical protein